MDNTALLNTIEPAMEVMYNGPYLLLMVEIKFFPESESYSTKRNPLVN